MKKTSEFGKGLTYCIGLFLAHAEREIYGIGEDKDYHIWFNGSSDHLYDLDLSAIKNASLKRKLADWQTKVIHWGHGFSAPYPTKEDFEWAVQQAKDFLREIDVEMGVKAVKGKWE